MIKVNEKQNPCDEKKSLDQFGQQMLKRKVYSDFFSCYSVSKKKEIISG